MDAFLEISAWRGYRRADFPTESWTVEGDALCALANGPQVDLVTREGFGDFDLSFEWRLPVGGNSGVLYHVDESLEAAWQSGPELQLVHDSGHPDGRVPETSCGAIYGLMAPGKPAACHVGLFNVGRISVRGTQVEHWLNGVRVLACDLGDETFRRRVQQSKFAGYPRFAARPEGHIALQHHGTEACFRDFRITTF